MNNAVTFENESIGDKRRDAALAWLHARINFEQSQVVPYNEQQLKLARMRTLLGRLGRPDAGQMIVHIAGTKGKGSTATMIAAVLTAAGYRAGVFSSPHLERIEERFAVNGQSCSAAELAALVERLQLVVAALDAEAEATGDSGGGPTYFEVTTAMAFVHFAQRKVDAAVLEVGLGGRLDATNVCRPAVSVITSISFDHMQQLGHTLGAIAGEKAGIIKPGAPVVSGVRDAEPQAVIAAVAQAKGCRLIQVGSDFNARYRAGRLDFESTRSEDKFTLADVSLALRGSHQAANAAVALATLVELRRQGWSISTEAMRSGLAAARLPGRVEVLAGVPTVVLDTAHNAASAQALVEALDEIQPDGRRTLILAVSRDKDVRAIVRTLLPAFDRVIATEFRHNPRAVPASELAELVRAESADLAACGVDLCNSPREAWEEARRGVGPDELVCIAGSFYLAAELRSLVISPDTSSKLDR